eukprot:136722-Pelagomonas_calceolata.AAC.5
MQACNIKLEQKRPAHQQHMLFLTACPLHNAGVQYQPRHSKLLLAPCTKQARDINLDIKRIVAYRHWCNKLYNAIRFASMNLPEDYQPPAHPTQLDMSSLPATPRWLLSKLSNASAGTVKVGVVGCTMCASAAPWWCTVMVLATGAQPIARLGTRELLRWQEFGVRNARKYCLSSRVWMQEQPCCCRMHIPTYMLRLSLCRLFPWLSYSVQVQDSAALLPLGFPKAQKAQDVCIRLKDSSINSCSASIARNGKVQNGRCSLLFAHTSPYAGHGEAMEAYEFANATQRVYCFWQYELCDVYIELMKPIMAMDDSSPEQASVVV